jgi:hypothetical protein
MSGIDLAHRENSVRSFCEEGFGDSGRNDGPIGSYSGEKSASGKLEGPFGAIRVSEDSSLTALSASCRENVLPRCAAIRKGLVVPSYLSFL